MCDDASPCDLKAIPRADRTDDFDRWSIEQAERLHPHYRYKIVCSKWGFQRVLGQGYRYGVARALSGVLMDMCAHARPMEDSWTRPIFRLELMRSLIRARQHVGDLAFVRHESNLRFREDGSLATFTSRELLVTIEEILPSGGVHRARSMSGLVVENPTVTKSFASDDVDMPVFTKHVTEMLDGCSEREAYDYLTSADHLTEAIFLYARHVIPRTAFDCDQAVECIRTIGLPRGHACPTIEKDRLEQQVTSILGGTADLRLAA